MGKSPMKIYTGIKSQSLPSPALNMGYLQNRCPLLFRAARFPNSYLCNLTYWGIECGDGWMHVVEKAAAAIEVELRYLIARIKLNLEVSEPDIQGALDEAGYSGQSFYELKETGNAPLIPFCSGVRESEGQLEISIVNGQLCDTTTWLRIQNILRDFKDEANFTCERCGRLGLYREGYWRRVLCEQCSNGKKQINMIYLTEFIST